ncbi:MAG: hypothetical protein HY453_01705 [Parcubacteria group bacterium]|nr:hypothetical protein [Parcubacteria group bacterium]
MEKEKFDPNETSKDIIIAEAFKKELEAMRARKPDRKDSKYTILESFLEKLKNQSFKEVFLNLKRFEKHAIITRLEGQSSHMGGQIPFSFVKELYLTTYGFIIDEDGDQRVNDDVKRELERELQDMNRKMGIYEEKRDQK